MFESIKKLLHFQSHVLAVPILQEASKVLTHDKEVLHDNFFRFKTQWNNLGDKIKQLEIHIKKLNFEKDIHKNVDELKTYQQEKYLFSLQKELKAYLEMKQELKEEMLHSKLKVSQIEYQIEKVNTKALMLSATTTTDHFDAEDFLCSIHLEAIDQLNHEEEILSQKIDHLLMETENETQTREDVKSFFKKNNSSDKTENEIISTSNNLKVDEFFSEESLEKKQNNFFNHNQKTKIDRFFKDS
ncbi:hypothetical protein [Flammeovirga pacifica]|uniref:PspA/IM30 family protein n=1 Tax=Flammeovirga pacifica TaxID=915059 RepID=A0A1S1Z3S4_FLAPC|nr:hypothetical protein [Flammeovirga pacifica]OHX67938.1 hypothetical protein NH26_17115 [Flammeovirga pacifica]